MTAMDDFIVFDHHCSDDYRVLCDPAGYNIIENWGTNI